MTWVGVVPGLTWPQAVPALVVAALVLWVPGAVLARLTGARGPGLVTVAPVLTAGVLALLAAAGSLVPALRGTWAPVPALLCLVAAGVAVAAVRLLAGWRAVPDGADRAGGVSWLPVGVASLVSALTFAHASGAAGTIEQSNDSPFHLLAVQRVATTGDGSWQNVRAVTGDTGFYPPLSDDLAALLLRVLHALHVPVDVVSATSVLLMLCVALVWPLGVDALVRAVLDRRPAGVPTRAGRALAALVVPATAAFPAQLLAYGALWPNLLGLSMAPAVLAALVVLLDGRPRRGRGRGSWTPALAVLVVVLGVPALALAHPSALLSAAVAAGGLVAATAVRVARSHRGGPLAVGAAALAVVVALVVVARRATGVTGFSASQPWSVPQALWRVLATNPVAGTAPALVGLLALVGAVVAVVGGHHRWLVAGWALAATQVVLAGSVDSRLTALLTGLWYHEPARLSSALVITAVPLAALGAAAVGDHVVALRRGARPAAAVLVAVALGWAAVGVRDVHAVERDTYQGLGPDRTLVTPDEMALYARTLGTSGDADGTGGVLGDPFGGTMFAGLASGRPVVVAHFGHALRAGAGVGGLSDTARVVYHFRSLTTDPQVCAALRRLHVGYVVEDTHPIWTDDPRASSYEALRGLAGRPGIVPLGTDGTTTVYRITACG